MVVWITILYVWDIKYIIKNYNGYFKRKLPYEFLLESAQRMFISHRPVFAPLASGHWPLVAGLILSPHSSALSPFP